jgi:Cd2+/Zn2+-exporting ATPase
MNGKDHREIVITLKGMDCMDCVNKLQKALHNVDGIKHVSLNFTSGKGRIEFNPKKVHLIQLNEIISNMGYEMVGEVVRYHLDNIHCRDCGHELEKDLEKRIGIIDASVSMGANTISVNFVPQEIRKVKIEDRIKAMGYKSLKSEEDVEVGLKKQRRKSILLGISAVLFALGLALHWMDLEPTFFEYEWNFLLVHITPSNILFLIALLIPGISIAKAGFYSLKGRVITIDFLVILAAIGAVLIGTYWEATAVVFLTAFGELLQDFSVEKTRRSLAKLLEGAPKTALVRRNGKIIEVEISELMAGDTAIVKAGEKIPADGKVRKGTSAVNQAPITGESVPVNKEPGDSVFGGTISEDGYLEMTVEKTGDDTTISRIIKLIQEAQEEKAPAQRFIEKFADIFVPVVILLSIATFFITGDIKNSLVLLVVACPCALVISTPVAVVSGLGNAAKQGILIKGGISLEIMGKVKTVIFDKTGTLTRGEHGISEIYSVDGKEDEVLEIAALAEQKSEHPISRAIMEEALKKNIHLVEPDEFKVIKGKGIRADFKNNNSSILVGKRSLMEDHSIKVSKDLLDNENRMENKALTVFFVAKNGKAQGIIGTADMVRNEALDLIKDLKKMRIRTVMLSGDNVTTVKVLGEKLGLDEVYGNLLPEDKVNHVKRLSEKGKVAMVGDGINDAPALAAADIGIAMGGSGSDLTIETSDITLLSDDISRISETIRLSRKTLRIIKQNTAFALLVVFGLILSASVGWIGLAVGVIGHESSALIVIANSMRLIKLKRKRKEGDEHDHPHENDHGKTSVKDTCSVEDNSCGCPH